MQSRHFPYKALDFVSVIIGFKFQTLTKVDVSLRPRDGDNNAESKGDDILHRNMLQPCKGNVS